MRPPSSFGFLSTFPPTRCGLATFSDALADALVAEFGARIRTVRVMDELAVSGTARPGSGIEVVAELQPGDPTSITRAAAELNRSDVAIVQHEYGIYGGRDGQDVIAVLQRLDVPVIVVLHTVLPDPTPHQKLVLERVAALAHAVVVMTDVAADILNRSYAIERASVAVIPHGVPTWIEADPAPTPREKRVVLTWGLIGPGKGIEWGIRAIAALRDAGVIVTYRVLGQTHPKVVATQGEAYRDSLLALVAELQLTDSVSIEGHYLDPAELAAAVVGADVVLLPYDSRDQVTSGVLVEALAAAKPVVATAFPHALELLDGRSGRVVAHHDPAAMAAAVGAVLESGALGRTGAPAPSVLSWPAAAERFVTLADRVRSEQAA